MNSLRLVFTLILAAFFLTPEVEGQTVLGKPEKFENPIHYEQDAANIRYRQSTGKKFKDRPWFVVSDRNNNPTYEKPDLSSAKKKTLNLNDNFYVTDEKEDWVRIAKGQLNRADMELKDRRAEDMGWIPKDKVLLWNSGLKDENTKIHKKVFLLNKVEDLKQLLERGNRTFAQIYEGPNSSGVVKTNPIYDFYFVYKIENDRYLIGSESLLPKSRVAEALIGWVRRQRLEDWNTRICLEPNFDGAGFQERKSDMTKRVIGYATPGAAKAAAKSGRVMENEKLWDNDPVKCEPAKLASTDPRRFKGEVVRFPMLRNNPEYFKSGTIGTIKAHSVGGILDDIEELNYSSILDKVKERREKTENFNFFFLVEGTRSMANFKPGIIKGLDKLESLLEDNVNIKYGVGIYRDQKEEQLGKLFELKELTKNRSDVGSFIHNAEFDQTVDQDDWTALRFGMYESLVKGGFSKNYTNILYIIGNHADYFNDITRRKAARDANDKTNIEWSLIHDKLAELEVDIIFVQCQNMGGRVYNKFAMDGKSTIVSSANVQYTEYSNLTKEYPDIKVPNPSLEFDDASVEHQLIGGCNSSVIYRPNPGTSITNADLEEFIVSKSEKIINDTEAWWENLRKFTMEGNALGGVASGDVSSATWEPRIARDIYRLFQIRKDAGYESEDLQKIVKEKWKLYKEIYLAKKVGDAEHPAFSYVMFMPEEDLEDYLEILKQLENAADGSLDQIRQALYNTFRNLLSQFTGTKSRTKAEQVTMGELSAIMQGVQDEGLVINPKYATLEIKDILNSKKVSEDQLNDMLKDFRRKQRELQKIVNSGNYEFTYNSTLNRKYYWIPVDLAL